MSWGWGDYYPCVCPGSTPVTPPTPVPVPVVEDSVTFSDSVAEALDRLPQQFKDKNP